MRLGAEPCRLRQGLGHCRDVRYDARTMLRDPHSRTPTAPVSFRHEQILRINDAGNSLAAPVPRSRLWAGLVHTIRQPEEHDSTIDASVCVEVSKWIWRRRVVRGSTVVADRIELTPESEIAVTVEEGPFAGSHSEIRIEEPAPGALFVRIVHVVQGPPVLLSPEEERARNAAYDAMNVSRISRARAAATAGTSGAFLLDS